MRGALWQAALSFDPAKAVPFPSFACRRIEAAAWTAYRQERRWGLRFQSLQDQPMADGDQPDDGSAAGPPAPSAALAEQLRDALSSLPPDAARILSLVILEGCSGVEAAKALGISPRLFSKRKTAALHSLLETGSTSILRISTEHPRTDFVLPPLLYSKPKNHSNDPAMN